MYKGSQKYYKSDMLVFLVHELLVNKVVDPKKVCIYFDISNRTLASYIRSIKLALFDFGIYYITIEYDRVDKVYKFFDSIQ